MRTPSVPDHAGFSPTYSLSRPPPTRLQAREALAEGNAEGGHVAQGVPHGQEVEVVVGERQLFDGPRPQRNREGQARPPQHAAARIEPDPRPGLTKNARGRPSHQTGPGRDVEELHARAEAGPQQDDAPIALAGAERSQRADPVVVLRSVVEEGTDEGPSLLLALVVLREDGMRRRG